jgi:hypothetical protein
MPKKEILKLNSAPRLEQVGDNCPKQMEHRNHRVDDELILPYRANRADGIFGNDTRPTKDEEDKEWQSRTTASRLIVPLKKSGRSYARSITTRGQVSKARPSSKPARRAIRSQLSGVSPSETRSSGNSCSPIPTSIALTPTRFAIRRPFPYEITSRRFVVAPIVETNKAFVEWWATFDCAADEYDRWTKHFKKEGFAKWLAALRRFMQTKGR